MDLFLIVGAGFFSVAIAMLALHFLWRSLANLPQPDLEWFETVLTAAEQKKLDELLREQLVEAVNNSILSGAPRRGK